MMCSLKPGVHNCQVGTPGETGGASSTGEEELGTRDCKLCTLIYRADCQILKHTQKHEPGHKRTDATKMPKIQDFSHNNVSLFCLLCPHLPEYTLNREK